MGFGNFFRRTGSKQDGDGDGDDISDGLDGPAGEFDEIGELLNSFEARGLEIFGRYGLPTVPGAYRRGPTGDWEFLASSIAIQDRWSLVLQNPPEDGWKYAKLADVGRQMLPQEREVMAAVSILDAVEAARREGMGEAGDFDPQKGSALKAGMRLVLALEASARLSRQKLYVSPLRDGDDDFSAAHLVRRKASEERHRLWNIWQTEAAEIWRMQPSWGSRAVATRLKKRLGLPDSVHTIRRRILSVAPPIPPSGAPKDAEPHSGLASPESGL